MIRKLALTSVFCLVTLLAFANGSERQLCIYKDSVVKICIKNYQKLTFYDSSGMQHTGKIFMPNDSQFYFLNYFKDKKSKVFNLKDIYAIDNLVNINTEINTNSRKQKTHLNTTQVALIVVLTGGFAAPILLIRELFLYADYGPGHARESYIYRQSKRLKNVQATIVNSTTI